MPTVIARHAADLDAPAAAVYAVIADYVDGHPRILPPVFHGLTVERGGVGDGTVIRFAMRVLGRDTWTRAAITEPDPGRVLVETGLDDSTVVTTFTVEPLDGGRRAHVRFDTVWTEPGLAGWVQRLVAPAFLRRVYAEEMANLERVARERG